MKSKGQAAMEFLMTYGWAILVVLIAVGALAYFGLLSPDKLLTERCVITPGSGLFCEDYSAYISSNNKFKLTLKNVHNRDISVTGFEVNYGTNNVTNYCNRWRGLPPVIIVSGGMQDIYAEPCLNMNLGDKVKANFMLTYSFVGSSLNKSVGGELVTTVTTYI